MGSHWSHWKVQSSLCALAVSNGGRGDISLYILISDCFEWALIGHIGKCRVYSGSFKWGEGDISCPYIFLLVDCFEWVLIGGIGQQRVDSVLWQFQMGGGGIIGRGIIVSLSALVFPYIFLLVDHFEWVLIDHIGQCRVHSVLWQFWRGEGDISLYILISWLFQMGSHWSHWKVQSSLCALAVSNGGRGDISLYILISWLFWMGSHWSHWKVQSLLWQFQMGGGGYFLSLYILISWLFWMGSYWWHWTAKSWLSALAVLNGGRGIIGRGDNHQFYLGKSENLSSLASQKVFSYYIWKT